MGVAAIDKEIANYVLQLTPLQKEAVLGIVKAFATEQFPDFDKEMNSRFADYESGKEIGYTLEETEERARKAYKALKK